MILTFIKCWFTGLCFCFSGLMILLLLFAGLSQQANLDLINSRPVLILIVSLPALLWGLCYSERANRFSTQLALFMLAVSLPRTVTIGDTDLTLFTSVALWCFGLLGLSFGRYILKE